MSIKLPNNDVHIQRYQTLMDEEFAKGSEADSNKIMMYIEAINVFFHGSVAAVHRVKQRERAHQANDSHEELVGSYKNFNAKFLQSAGGSIGVTGALFIGIVTIGGLLAGTPTTGTKSIMDVVSLLTNSFSTVASAAQSGDQANQAMNDHAVKTHQTERNDDQSTHQSTDAQKNEALRRMKEMQQQQNAAWSAVVSASR